MHEYEAGIIRTDHVGQDTFIIEADCPDIAREVTPGQFVQARASDGTDPFLRRTFSVCGADKEQGIVTFLIDVVGRGTELICDMKRGGTINLIGSLGTGFDFDFGGDGPAILVGGGTGAAPMIFLAHRLIEETCREVTFMMGARTASGHAAVEQLLDDSVPYLKATDDGSAGYHGLVSGLLNEHISVIAPSALFTCGPRAMMKAVADISAERSLPCQVSLEERMACGVGACLGCAVEMRDGRMARSCVDGPVFTASEVIL